eukprot:gnl/MRDRNA2_/MRDRNA2_50873_c0_seq1.p1 gnl/MRDRNA2_/MRDRNA2_50873_c0~~gnl/MRDRNA2_/MRDRNA2_50873_c0_seq1.p1  ORF type:complete len:453 (-),score=110.80 gnl/MRDRNA2_/MRDRNA2_50873_c0_seq1:268-1626(-)
MAEPIANPEEGLNLQVIIFWGARIALAVLLFWVYVKFSPSDDDDQAKEGKKKPTISIPAFTGKSNPTKQVYSRTLLSKARSPKSDSQPGGITMQAVEAGESRGRSRTRETSKDKADKAEAKKMHLESLLNYVAFKKERGDTGDAGEEMGDRTRSASRARSASPETHSSEARTQKSEEKRANVDAQMVLRGALEFGRVDVAKQLYQQLVSTEVQIAERTYELMVEACLRAKDLSVVSDFLLKMEGDGYRPRNSTLKRVVALREQMMQEEIQGPKAHSSQESEDAQRTPLRSEAAPFFTQADTAQRTPLTAAAAPFHTSLSKTASPFVPAGWESDQPTWTGTGNAKDGKGKGKGNMIWKSKWMKSGEEADPAENELRRQWNRSGKPRAKSADTRGAQARSKSFDEAVKKSAQRKWVPKEVPKEKEVEKSKDRKWVEKKDDGARKRFAAGKIEQD